LGCSLDFLGEDVNLVTPNITSKELEIVSQRTRIIFPEGSTGLGYFSKDQESTRTGVLSFQMAIDIVPLAFSFLQD